MGVPAVRTTPVTVAVTGGVLYAGGALSWLFSSGVRVSAQNLATVAAGVGYAGVGMFLVAAAPLYLCGRYSLVTPALMTLWMLGNTVSEWLYGTHLHPLSSYLIVWPLLLGIAVGAGVLEAVVRVGLDRGVDRFGLRPLV